MYIEVCSIIVRVVGWDKEAGSMGEKKRKGKKGERLVRQKCGEALSENASAVESFVEDVKTDMKHRR